MSHTFETEGGNKAELSVEENIDGDLHWFVRVDGGAAWLRGDTINLSPCSVRIGRPSQIVWFGRKTDISSLEKFIRETGTIHNLDMSIDDPLNDPL